MRVRAFGSGQPTIDIVGAIARKWCATTPSRVRSCPSYPNSDAAQVDFSRDGESAAYVRFTDATLWRIKLDGSDRIQLTYPPLHVTVPHWSPDGTQIAFSGAKPGDPNRV